MDQEEYVDDTAMEEIEEEHVEEAPELEEEEIEEEEGADEESDEEEEESEAKGKKKPGGEVQELEDLLDEDSMNKKVRIKVNGEEQVMTVKEAIKVKQLEEASRANMKQSAADRKMVRQLANLAKQDPKKFMQLVGHDPYEFAEATVAERIEMASMPKEQREAMAIKAENERLRQENETFQQRQQREAHETKVSQEYETFENQITEAWEESKLPDQPLFRSSIAQAMLADRKAKVQEAIDMGHDPKSIDPASFLTAQQATAIVKENWVESVRSTFKNMDAEAILEVLDKDTVTKVRKASIKRVSDKTSPKYSKGPGKKRPASNNRKQKDTVSEDDYRKWQEQLAQLAGS